MKRFFLQQMEYTRWGWGEALARFDGLADAERRRDAGPGAPGLHRLVGDLGAMVQGRRLQLQGELLPARATAEALAWDRLRQQLLDELLALAAWVWSLEEGRLGRVVGGAAGTVNAPPQVIADLLMQVLYDSEAARAQAATLSRAHGLVLARLDLVHFRAERSGAACFG